MSLTIPYLLGLLGNLALEFFSMKYGLPPGAAAASVAAGATAMKKVGGDGLPTSASGVLEGASLGIAKDSNQSGGR